MIIDFHTHLLPPSFIKENYDQVMKDQTFASMFGKSDLNLPSTEDLIRSMEADDIDASVVMGYGWCDYEIAKASNDFILEAAQKYHPKIIPFCSVQPDWGDLAVYEIERCLSLGAKGIGELHPTSQSIDLALSESISSLVQISSENDMPIVIHGSEPVGHKYPGKGLTSPEQLASFAMRFPEASLVFAHWGGGLPFYALMPEVRELLKNVFFDSAASPFLYDALIFSIADQIIGAEKIIFGSDYPLLSAKRVMRQVFETLSPEKTNLVMGENANNLLHWFT